MAHCSAPVSDGKFGDLRFGENSPVTETLITVIGVLLKQVLDLRETLAFYDANLYQTSSVAAGEGCTKSDTREAPMVFG
jgi:hypothetical protein